MTPPLLLSVFPSFAIGGAQARFATIANHLGPAWRHAIVSMDGVVAARERLCPELDVTFPDAGVRKGNLLANVRRFRSMLRALRPATLLTHNFGSIEWAIANRHRVAHHVHVEDGFGPEERDSQIPRRVWLRRAFLRGRAVVLPSRALLRIARETWRLDPRDLHYVPNGVDLALFDGPGTLRTWPGEGTIVGTVAAFRAEKNIGRLIRAFARVDIKLACRLVLIGDGPQRPELEALVDQLGLRNRVHFEGHVSKPADWIRSLDIFAMSSDTEQMPISLIEAMTAGRPAVATDVGDISAMLPEIGRRFVTPCDDDALARALASVIGDVPLQKALGQANRDMARRSFSQADMFARWSELLVPLPGRKA